MDRIFFLVEAYTMPRKALTEKTVDHSDLRGYCFSFFCEICGKEWISSRQPFSGGCCTAVENDEALKMLWSAEHRAAFDEANLEAHFHFSRCPFCGKWVCTECFSIEDDEFGGSCRECNGEENEE